MPVHIKGSGGVQKTPNIAYGYDGLVMATAGKKSATLQLPTQSGATITPSRVTQTAVPAYKFTTGEVYVQGDTDLLPKNIVSGVSIFGVAGTATTHKYGISGQTEGDGGRTIRLYFQNALFNCVDAIFVNASKTVVNDGGIISLALFPDRFCAIGKQGNGYFASDSTSDRPTITSSGDGFVTITIPSSSPFYFDWDILYTASAVGY